MILFLKILGGLAALGLGVYLGLSGTSPQSSDDIEKALGPGGRTKRVKKRFTPLGWLRNIDEPSSRRRRRGGGSSVRFNLAAPGDPVERKGREKDPAGGNATGGDGEKEGERKTG